MRHLLAAILLLAVLAPAAAAAESGGTYEWRPIMLRDCPEAPRKALIERSEALSGGEEIGAFAFAQTPMEVAEVRFRATFTAAGKRHTLIAKPDGTIEKEESVALGEPAGATVADPKAPGSGAVAPKE